MSWPSIVSIFNWMVQLTQGIIVTQIPSSSKHAMKYDQARKEQFCQPEFCLPLFPLLILCDGFSTAS